MKGIFSLLLVIMLCIVTIDYMHPLDIPVLTERNPLVWIEDGFMGFVGTQEENSNIVPLSEYNLDFENGTIGWHLHYLYSVPPDYWETTYEQAKSGRASLRLAHTCDTTTTNTLTSVQTKQCLFRTSKLPEFTDNVFVKFYIKTQRKYENSWWDTPLFEFATKTYYEFDVEAVDEWGTIIYQKDIVSDIYNYQNSQLTKIIEYDMISEGNASDYFKKINGYDYNATYNGSIESLQAMIDLQNSLTSGTVYYYIANVDSLPTSSYAVYLGNGWYTVIMPIPKETRYLGFNSKVYCIGQNATWNYGPYMTVYYPDAPSSADTLTYLDGIVFIKTVTDSDVAITNSVDNSNWTNDVDENDNSNSNTTLTEGSWFTKILRLFILIVIFGIIFILAFPKRTQKVRNKLGINKVEKSAKKLPMPKAQRNAKPIYVKGHYRVNKGEGKGKGGIF